MCYVVVIVANFDLLQLYFKKINNEFQLIQSVLIDR